MAKSFVLRALRVFSLEEMLNLAEARRVKTSLMKKAAGEELVVWDDVPETTTKVKAATPETSDNVLPFQKKTAIKDVEPLPDPALKDSPEGETSTLLSSEFILWQRELTKDSGAPHSKKDAVKGYSKATEMYVVKTPDVEGKEKIRFASTNGVLVNKKQA